MTKKRDLIFYSVMIAYKFDIKIRRCEFCKAVIGFEPLDVRDFGVENS